MMLGGWEDTKLGGWPWWSKTPRGEAGGRKTELGGWEDTKLGGWETEKL